MNFRSKDRRKYRPFNLTPFSTPSLNDAARVALRAAAGRLARARGKVADGRPDAPRRKYAATPGIFAPSRRKTKRSPSQGRSSSPPFGQIFPLANGFSCVGSFTRHPSLLVFEPVRFQSVASDCPSVFVNPVFPKAIDLAPCWVNGPQIRNTFYWMATLCATPQQELRQATKGCWSATRRSVAGLVTSPSRLAARIPAF